MQTNPADCFAAEDAKAKLFQLWISDAGNIEAIRKVAIKLSFGRGGILTERVEGVDPAVVG